MVTTSRWSYEQFFNGPSPPPPNATRLGLSFVGDDEDNDDDRRMIMKMEPAAIKADDPKVIRVRCCADNENVHKTTCTMFVQSCFRRSALAICTFDVLGDGWLSQRAAMSSWWDMSTYTRVTVIKVFSPRHIAAGQSYLVVASLEDVTLCFFSLQLCSLCESKFQFKISHA